jgi:hypothetical protein
MKHVEYLVLFFDVKTKYLFTNLLVTEHIWEFYGEALSLYSACGLFYYILKKIFFTYSVLFIYITFVFISYKDINLLIVVHGNDGVSQ